MVAKVVSFLFAPVARLLAGNPVFIKAVLERVNITAVADALKEGVMEDIDMDDLARRAAQNIVASDVASHIECGDIVDAIELADLAGEIDAEDIARHIDWSDIEVDLSEVAENLCLSSLAEKFDLSEVVSNIDMHKLAQNCDVSDAVNDVLCNGDDMIDYQELAKALLGQLVKANTVEVRPAGV